MAAKLAKKDVLDRINAVLVVAGLNDNVWSIRDCDSTLFVLLFKKLFGKIAGIVSPVSAADHASNFEVVLGAISADVLEMDLSHIEPEALAKGDLKALYDLAEIFSELCELLLKREDETERRPDSTTGGGMPARPASAVPAGTCSPREAALPVPVGGVEGGIAADDLDDPADDDPEPSAAYELPHTSSISGRYEDEDDLPGGVGGGGAPTIAACARAALPSGPPSAGSAKRPTSARAAKSAAAKAKGAAAPRIRPGRPASAPSRPARKQVEQAERLKALKRLEKQLLATMRGEAGEYDDGAPPTNVPGAATVDDAFARRAKGAYDALARQQAARARQAAALEIQRNSVSARNGERDARIEQIRMRRLSLEASRLQQARTLLRASKDDLSYRHLYRQGIELGREQLRMEVAAGVEACKKLEQERRARQLALEHFYEEQRAMLQEQLRAEQLERSFREHAQRAMAGRADAEARRAAVSALGGLKDELAYMERVDYGVAK